MGAGINLGTFAVSLAVLIAGATVLGPAAPFVVPALVIFAMGFTWFSKFKKWQKAKRLLIEDRFDNDMHDKDLEEDFDEMDSDELTLHAHRSLDEIESDSEGETKHTDDDERGRRTRGERLQKKPKLEKAARTMTTQSKATAKAKTKEAKAKAIETKIQNETDAVSTKPTTKPKR